MLLPLQCLLPPATISSPSHSHHHILTITFSPSHSHHQHENSILQSHQIIIMSTLPEPEQQANQLFFYSSFFTDDRQLQKSSPPEIQKIFEDNRLPLAPFVIFDVKTYLYTEAIKWEEKRKVSSKPFSV